MVVELFKDYVSAILQLTLELIRELFRYTLPSLLITTQDYQEGCGRGSGASFKNSYDDYLLYFKENDSNSQTNSKSSKPSSKIAY